MSAANITDEDADKADILRIIDDAPGGMPPRFPVNNTAKPSPDTTASDSIQARFWKIDTAKGLTASDRHHQMAAAVIDFLKKRGRFYFNSESPDFAGCLFFDATRKLLLPLAADRFQSWLAGFIGINRAEHSYKFIFSALQDAALSGPDTTGILPEHFWAARAGACYLSNGDGRLLKITANGLSEADNGLDGVLFPAGATLAPWKLTEPQDPFEACRLFRDMASVQPHGLDLLRLWAVSLPSNQRCKPPLVLTGPVGSGKTRLAGGLFELYGIPSRILSLDEADASDFWTQQDAGGLVCFDNADTHVKWLADALSSAATAGAHEKRKLYTNGIIVRQMARAWNCLTSANPSFASDAGLADRLLVIRLDRRIEDTAESALADEIAANRDAGLSWIAVTLTKALAAVAPISGKLNRRHPDHAALCVRIGRAIGREAEAVAALTAAEQDKGRFNLENDELGVGLLALMSSRETFSGSASELLTELAAVDPATFNVERWTAKRVGKRLAKIWPHAESVLRGKLERDRDHVAQYYFRSVCGIS